MSASDSPRRKPAAPQSLRRHLLGIVFLALVPLLVFAAVMVVLLAVEERDTFRRGAMDRTLALVTAVDRELERSIAALEALATSHYLDDGSFGAFHGQAQRVLASRPEWTSIDLASRSGRRILSLEQPPHTELPAVRERETFEEVLRSGRPAIGHLFREPGSGEPVFNVRVPVLRDGRVEYVLSALVRPDAMGALLAPQGLPRDWVGVILDRNENIVARTISNEEMVGRPASGSLRAALSRSDHGWFHGATLEHWRVYSPYTRSRFSGWTVALGIPAQAVEAGLWRSVALLVPFGLGLLALALGLAWLLSGRTARTIRHLAARAQDIGTGRGPEASPGMGSVPTRVAEVEELRQALAHADGLLQARAEERDRVEASLRSVQASLSESDRRKDQFLAMLGHELRNPLGILSTCVQLQKMGAAAAVGSDLQEMMERQVADMSRLIDDLLDINRIAQGRINVQRKLLDLTDIVRLTARDQRESFSQSGIELETDLPDRPLWVMGDATRLTQVVANLLSNAQKFTSSGGRTTVHLSESPDGGEARLTVRDTGVGIEPEILAHVFEPFSQADRTLDRSRGGLGLGLALVKGLVELHGGSVAAASEGSGRGAEFTVRLPLEPGTLPLKEAPRRENGRQARPRRILVVEDNRMAARSIGMFLAAQGHSVEVAHSGPAGIDAARRLLPEVVLCDIGLPELDGYAVARAIRREEDLEDVYLIAITGYGQASDRRNALAAGFDRYLSKPVDLDELHEMLTQVGPGAD